jgi:hypothetical protein
LTNSTESQIETDHSPQRPTGIAADNPAGFPPLRRFLSFAMFLYTEHSFVFSAILTQGRTLVNREFANNDKASGPGREKDGPCY